MTKQEFLKRLRKKLKGLSGKEAAQRITFYSEMIDDRIEEGLSEEEAVAEIGSIDEVAAQIAAEAAEQTAAPKRKLQAWQIVLLVLGAPLWLPLVLAAAAVALSLYVTVWAALISLWAADLALAVGALGGVALSVAAFCTGGFAQGLLRLAAGCVFAGLAIFLFFGCLYATKGVILGTKRLFYKKEETT